MLATVKRAVNISAGNTSRDADINDLINAAIADLTLAGVASAKAQNVTDPLIKSAIKTYCQISFTTDIAEAERLQKAYDSLKSRLTMAVNYT